MCVGWRRIMFFSGSRENSFLNIREVVGVRVEAAEVQQVRDAWQTPVDAEDRYDWLAKRLRKVNLISLHAIGGENQDDEETPTKYPIHYLAVNRLCRRIDPDGE